MGGRVRQLVTRSDGQPHILAWFPQQMSTTWETMAPAPASHRNADRSSQHIIFCYEDFCYDTEIKLNSMLTNLPQEAWEERCIIQKGLGSSGEMVIPWGLHALSVTIFEHLFQAQGACRNAALPGDLEPNSHIPTTRFK